MAQPAQLVQERTRTFQLAPVELTEELCALLVSTCGARHDGGSSGEAELGVAGAGRASAAVASGPGAPAFERDAGAEAVAPERAAAEHSFLDIGPVADPGRMRDAGFCDPSDVDALWAQKARLDELFDAGQAEAYASAREQLFPAAGSGGSGGRRRGNRAAEKLEELSAAVGGLEASFRRAPETTVFVDVCGAPGAWSTYLFRLGAKVGASMRGFGFSLRMGTNPLSCAWYPELARPDFTPLFGADGSGDVCIPANLAHAISSIGSGTASLVVADGGFGVSGGSGAHLENYQEVLSSGVLLSEVLVALRALSVGGSFLCKFFDTFSHLTVGLLFVLSAAFEEVSVVKPRLSRVVNSERYVIARGFRGADGDGVAALIRAVQAAHEAWPTPSEAAAPQSGPWSGAAPRSVVPRAALEMADNFEESVREMARSLCRQQVDALKVVIDRAVELRSTGGVAVAASQVAKRRRRCGSKLGR